MATFNRFEDIISWQRARVFCQQVFIICTTTPLERDYKLRGQMNGSSGSVMDNIAEGFGRGGNSEFIHFLTNLVRRWPQRPDWPSLSEPPRSDKDGSLKLRNVLL